MATHSSIVAWEISWTEDPSELQSMGSQKSRTRLKELSTHTGGFRFFQILAPHQDFSDCSQPMENRCGLHLPWSLTAFYIHLMPNITFCFGKNSHLFCIQNLLDRKLLLMSWKTLVFVFLSVHFLLETSWFKNDGWKTKWICTHFSYSDGDYYYNSSNMQLLMSLKFHHPFNSVQLSHSVMCDSLWPRGLQHSRLPCPSLSPGVCSNSHPMSWS